MQNGRQMNISHQQLVASAMSMFGGGATAYNREIEVQIGEAADEFIPVTVLRLAKDKHIVLPEAEATLMSGRSLGQRHAKILTEHPEETTCFAELMKARTIDDNRHVFIAHGKVLAITQDSDVMDQTRKNMQKTAFFSNQVNKNKLTPMHAVVVDGNNMWPTGAFEQPSKLIAVQNYLMTHVLPLLSVGGFLVVIIPMIQGGQSHTIADPASNAVSCPDPDISVQPRSQHLMLYPDLTRIFTHLLQEPASTAVSLPA